MEQITGWYSDNYDDDDDEDDDDDDDDDDDGDDDGDDHHHDDNDNDQTLQLVRSFATTEPPRERKTLLQTYDLMSTRDSITRLPQYMLKGLNNSE